MFKKIYIEVTNHCNLKCSFCKTNVRDKSFLSVEQFSLIIEKIKGYTNYIYLHVLGEPLLHKDLLSLILICKDNNMKVNITTNGTLLDKNKHIIFNKSVNNIHQMNISVHSQYETIMDENTYFASLFDFLQNSKDKFYVNLRLWNEDDNYISADNCEVIDKICNNLDVENTIKKEYNRNKSFTLSKNIFLHIDKKFVWPNVNGNKIFTKGKCYGLKDHIGILSNGTIVPCCLDGDGEMSLGNIFVDSLKEALSSEKAINMKNSFKNHQVIEKYCMTCGFGVRNNN